MNMFKMMMMMILGQEAGRDSLDYPAEFSAQDSGKFRPWIRGTSSGTIGLPANLTASSLVHGYQSLNILF